MATVDGKRHIIVFALVTALCLIGDSMLYIALPVHFEEAGLSSLWEVGVILAVNRIVRLPLNPCAGWFYSHVSEKAGILIAVCLAFAATLSYGYLDSFALWIVARCVWGVAWTLLRLGSLFCILKLATPATRGYYTGLYNGLYRLGSLVGMLVGGVLADTVGFKATALIFAVATGCALLPAIVFFPGGNGAEKECDAGASILEGLKRIARSRDMVRIIITGALVALVIQGVIASTLSRLIAVHTGGTVTLAGLVVGAASLAGVFQALRWGWEPWLAPMVGRLGDTRYGWPGILAGTFLAAGALYGLLALRLPLTLWLACLLGVQLAATALTTAADAAASECAASGEGRLLLMQYALFTDVGAALGPLTAYAMDGIWGIDVVYASCAVLFLCLAMVWRRAASEHFHL